MPLDHVFQGDALEVLHRDKCAAVFLPDVINGADVGMVQRRRRLCLALKAAERRRVFGYFIGQELQGYKAAQPGVFGLIHHSHAASTQFFQDAVIRDDLFGHSPAKRDSSCFIIGSVRGRVNERELPPVVADVPLRVSWASALRIKPNCAFFDMSVPSVWFRERCCCSCEDLFGSRYSGSSWNLSSAVPNDVYRSRKYSGSVNPSRNCSATFRCWSVRMLKVKFSFLCRARV